MKSKAKSAKGSARTKRFDVGGTVGALAGLGTLAYLMSRKKKGEDGKAEFKPQGNFPGTQRHETATPDAGSDDSKVVKPPSGVIFEEDRRRERALRQSKGQGDLVPEGADRDTLYESDKALVRTDGGQTTPVVKKKYTPPLAAQPKTSQSSSTTTGVDAGIAAGNKKKDVVTSAKPSKYTTPGDPNAKGSTQKGRSENPIQGTIDSATRSTVRTDAEKMRERALEVERRRQAENKKKDDEAYMKGALKKGGSVKKYASGGSVKASGMGSVKTAKPSMSSASKRADGIAQRGKTRGRVC